MQQPKSGFKRAINWSKYEQQQQQQHRMLESNILIFLFEPSFQGVNRIFDLTFNTNDSRIGHLRYYLPTEKVEDYNVMIDGGNIFDQSIKNDIKTSGPGDDINWLFARLQLFYKKL